jgi:hypothetical protein
MPNQAAGPAGKARKQFVQTVGKRLYFNALLFDPAAFLRQETRSRKRAGCAGAGGYAGGTVGRCLLFAGTLVLQLLPFCGCTARFFPFTPARAAMPRPVELPSGDNRPQDEDIIALFAFGVFYRSAARRAAGNVA